MVLTVFVATVFVTAVFIAAVFCVVFLFVLIVLHNILLFLNKVNVLTFRRFPFVVY